MADEASGLKLRRIKIMARRSPRFTVFDVMEARGDFENNTANSSSPEYSGPQPYPQMFYHPQGTERVIKPGELIVTPLGPKFVGELREIIWKIASDASEAKALRDAGWHDRPAKAIAANYGGDAPAMSPEETIQALNAQIAELQAQANGATGAMLADTSGRSSGTEVLPQKPARGAAPIGESKQ